MIELDIKSLLTRTAGTGLADRQHEFIISDATPDDFGTVFLPDGWDLSQRMAGKKKVTYGHPAHNENDPDFIIGIGEERIDNNALMSILTIEPESTQNRIANTVHEKLIFGSLTDASIRAYIIDGRQGDETRGENPKLFYFTRHILIDWGVVPQGSNPSAVKTRSTIADFIKSKVPASRQRDMDIIRSLSVRYYTM